jgi:PIN domain nuclease of toxin-antitoxin system
LTLLDTHVLVWLMGARERLSQPARETIDAASELAISVASVQEVAYLVARGCLAVDRPLETWFRDAMGTYAIRAIAANVAVALRAGSFDPGSFHGDPIDRLIYATAVEHDAKLVTADRRLLEADPARTVW